MCPAIHKDDGDNVLNHEIFSEDPKELRETLPKVNKIIDNLEKTVLYLITFSRATRPIRILYTHIEIVVVVNMILASLHGILGPLPWRHNDHDSVSNHQPHGCLLNRLFRRRSKKTSKLRVTGLCVGNSPGPVNSPHKGPVTRKTFLFYDVIMQYSLSRRTSYGKISWSLQAARFIFRLFHSLWHLTGTSASELLLSDVVFISNAEYLEFFVWNALEPLPTVGRGVTGVRQGFEFIKHRKY